jgi:pimeloyl-ACP methyl ester carboxylesterase
MGCIPARWRAAIVAAMLALPQGSNAQVLRFPTLDDAVRAGNGRVAECAQAGVTGRMQCGTFRVWENRTGRTGRTIDIAFIVLSAMDRTAAGSDAVLHLPGGPGQTFVDAAVPMSQMFAAVRRARDMILIDVRGVGRSQGLDCNVPYPGGLRSRFGSVFALAHVTACRDTLRRRADLSMYTTDNTVDDLEELRAWLRYSQWNLIGGSYGTRVAQIYMRRHPKSVRIAVMNGIIPVGRPAYVQHARVLQRALERVVAGCETNEQCRRTQPQLAVKLADLLTRFRRGPVDVDVQGQRIPFTIGDLSYALRGLLYNRAVDVPRFITAAAAGDIRPLADYYLERTAWVSNRGGAAGYHLSVLCAEDIAPLTDADVARATAGTFMGARLIDAYRSACNVWPHARLPQSFWTPVRSDIPTLLLSGGRDPVTPPEDGAEVARYLSRSRHVVIPNGGHGVAGACITQLTLRLIETASVDRLEAIRCG